MELESILKENRKNIQTPCIIYDYECLINTSEALLSTLPEKAELLYSIKANPNLTLIKLFQKWGILFEVASEGELMHLMCGNISTRSIVFSGQGKTISGIKNAITNGVMKINIESYREWENVSKLASLLGKRIDVILRVNPILDGNEAGLKMGGISSPYGVDEETLDIYFRNDAHLLPITGLFMYAGSNYHNYKHIVNNTDYLFHLAERIYNKFGVKLNYLDFGGGFGVPEFEDDEELDLKSLKSELDELFEKKLKHPCFAEIKNMYFESGRYLTTKSGTLITRVLDIKTSRGKKYIITDGGINCMGIKQMEYRRTEPNLRLVKMSRESVSNEEVCIVGTTCTPIDIVHRGVALPQISIGDFICIEDSGSYSVTFSPQNFCGQVSPAEYMVKDNILLEIKKKGDVRNPYGYSDVCSDISIF